MRKIEVTRTWYRVVSRSSVYRDRAQAHGCRSEKWPWAIVEDCIVVVGDGLQKVVGPKPDLPNRLLRPCNIMPGQSKCHQETIIVPGIGGTLQLGPPFTVDFGGVPFSVGR